MRCQVPYNCSRQNNPTTASTKPTEYPTTISPDSGKGDWKTRYGLIFGTPGVLAVFSIVLAGVFIFNRRRRYNYTNIDSPIMRMSASENFELNNINFNT